MQGDAVVQGLPRGLVESWEASLGRAGEPLGSSLKRLHASGSDGLRRLCDGISADQVTAPEPEGFEVRAYARRLVNISAFALLHTPVRMTYGVSREPMVFVGLSSLPAPTTIDYDGTEYRYGPRQLVVLTSARAHTRATVQISDPLGVTMPLSLLGRQGEALLRMPSPVLPDTTLTRSATAFLTRFVTETISAPVTPNPRIDEYAVLDLVMSMISQLRGGPIGTQDRSLYIREATRELIDRYYAQTSLTATSLADLLNISRRQLYRYFDGAELSITEMITQRRVQAAQEHLTADPTMSVVDVAASVGFANAATLRNNFQARYGVSPSVYQQRHRQSQGGRGARPALGGAESRSAV